MLGLYYLLARHEEEDIRERYGSDAHAYLANTPMFNPFRKMPPNGRPSPRTRALAIWIVGFVTTLLLAFVLRAVTVSQLYVTERHTPDVTALSYRAMSDDMMLSIMESTLATDVLVKLLELNPNVALLMQINNGLSQLKHLFVDLGMKAEKRRALELPDDGYFVVVSRVVARDPAAAVAPRVFSLAARTEPILLVVLPRGSAYPTASPVVVELTEDHFYPNFARILF